MRHWFLGGFVALGLLLSACGGGGDGDEKASDDSESTDRGDDSDEGTRGSAAGDGKDGAEPEDTAADDGGDAEGSGPSRNDYVDALGSAADPGAPDAEAMNCVTNAYIDVIGLERLNETTSPEEVAQSGLPSPAELGIELTQEEGDKFYDAVSQCMDFRELFFGSIASTDPAVDACLREKITDEQLKELVVAMFIQPSDAEPPDSTAIETAMNECQGLAAPPSG